jgi:hypothetical protein
VPKVLQSFCARVGTERILTSTYAPQTDGMVVRFNAIPGPGQVRDARGGLGQHLGFAVFRYNATSNEAHLTLSGGDEDVDEYGRQENAKPIVRHFRCFRILF